MVAVRGSHLLNPKDFNIHHWCENLDLPEQIEQDLTKAWQYARANAELLFLNSHWYLRAFGVCVKPEFGLSQSRLGFGFFWVIISI